MNFFSNIRNLYTPIQPTVKQSANDVTYLEFLPDPRLQNYIYCYWQLRTQAPLTDPFIYRVVADGCIDIFFELNNPSENFVMGFCRQYTEFPLENAFNYVGIRFFPTIFPQLFRVNASELSNRSLPLTEVVPQTAGFIENQFHPGQEPTEIKSILDNYFLNHFAAVSFENDNRLYKAIDLILQNQGMIDVQKDLDTGVSPRQLQRIFGYYIGDTAKSFSKVVRFQNILKAKPSAQSLKKNKLFFDLGYFDQSHFIKEFKNFYGVTPSKAFGR